MSILLYMENNLKLILLFGILVFIIYNTVNENFTVKSNKGKKYVTKRIEKRAHIIRNMNNRNATSSTNYINKTKSGKTNVVKSKGAKTNVVKSKGTKTRVVKLKSLPKYNSQKVNASLFVPQNYQQYSTNSDNSVTLSEGETLSEAETLSEDELQAQIDNLN